MHQTREVKFHMDEDFFEKCPRPREAWKAIGKLMAWGWGPAGSRYMGPLFIHCSTKEGEITAVYTNGTPSPIEGLKHTLMNGATYEIHAIRGADGTYTTHS